MISVHHSSRRIFLLYLLGTCWCVFWDFFYTVTQIHCSTCSKDLQAFLQCDQMAIVTLRGKNLVRLKPSGLFCIFTVRFCWGLYLSSLLNLRRLPSASSGWRPFLCTWWQLSQSFLLVISGPDFISPTNIISNHVWSELSRVLDSDHVDCMADQSSHVLRLGVYASSMLHCIIDLRSLLKGKTIISMKLFMNNCFQLVTDTN